MQVSVIIPTYNEEATIRQVLDMVLARVENLHEVIVIDDGSTDGTAEICQEFEQKIHWSTLFASTKMAEKPKR